MSEHADSKKVVVAALAGNVAIALCKFGAAYLSQSTATLAEAVHSLADTGNQALLLVGLRLAAKPPDERFPFGHATEKYFWPFVVALILFSVGGAFAIWEGVSHVLTPPEHPGSRLWSYGVLGVSFVFESMSFRVAYGEFKVLSHGKTWRQAIMDTRDPTIPLVLAEDATAIAGLSVALVSVGVSQVTGQGVWDPAGSILIGVILCGVAFALARITHGLLIGESAMPEDQGLVVDIAEKTPGVQRITQILTMHLGPDVVILTMKVAFRPGMPVEEVEDTINEMERRIRKEMPQMRKIFIEPDSHGDGRGLAVARSSRRTEIAEQAKAPGEGRA
jgi:cation diffusion facilitator family transporter